MYHLSMQYKVYSCSVILLDYLTITICTGVDPEKGVHFAEDQKRETAIIVIQLSSVLINV